VIEVRIAIPDLLVLQRFEGISRIVLVASPNAGSSKAVGIISDESVGKGYMTWQHL